MKIFLLLTLISVSFLTFSCSDNNPISPELELDREIGQMLLIGFRGLAVDAASPIIKDIASGRIGGVVLFDRDVALNSSTRNIESPQQVQTLITQLQSYSRIPLLVSVDQEGGYVARLKSKYGFSANVSQAYLGTINNPDSTRFYGRITAETLHKMGFNVNFAPVVDLNINPNNPVIGKIDRSFSIDPEIVVNNAAILIDEFKKQNINSTLKHFPGHGSSASDSHLGLTDVTNTWQESELKPYKELISKDYQGMIMTAHIFNSKLDPDYPATLSNKIINGILRKQLGFDGVIISDDMNMKAITDFYGLEKAIELSINAGVDILVFANNLTYDESIAIKATNIIKNLIKSGQIPESRIQESYLRIQKLKSKTFL